MCVRVKFETKRKRAEKSHYLSEVFVCVSTNRADAVDRLLILNAGSLSSEHSFYGHVWLRRGPNACSLLKFNKIFQTPILYTRVSSPHYLSMTINESRQWTTPNDRSGVQCLYTVHKGNEVGTIYVSVSLSRAFFSADSDPFDTRYCTVLFSTSTATQQWYLHVH